MLELALNQGTSEDIQYESVHHSYDIEEDKHDPEGNEHREDEKCLCMACNDNEEAAENGNQNLYTCKFCDKTFSCKKYLTNHSCVHSGLKPFICDFCNKSFRKRMHLVEHVRIHTGEKPYCCHICNKPFSRKFYLTKHMYTHSGGKPFK